MQRLPALTRARLQPNRPIWVHLALVVTVACALFMVTSMATVAVAAPGGGVSLATTTPYVPVNGFNPDIQGNVTIASTELSSPLSYSTTSGFTTTWSSLPAEINTAHVQNTTVINPADVVAHGVLQGDLLPGEVTQVGEKSGQGECGTGVDAEQTWNCHQWDNASLGWESFSDAGKGVNATVANATINGASAITITVNASSSTDTSGHYAIVGAELVIPVQGPSGGLNGWAANIAQDYITASYELSGTGTLSLGTGTSVAAGFAVGNDTSGLGLVPTLGSDDCASGEEHYWWACSYSPGVAIPAENASSGDELPYDANIYNYGVAPQTAGDYWSLRGYNNNWTTDSTDIGPGQSAYVTTSLASLDGPQAGFNISSPGSPCTEPGDPGCTSTVYLEFWVGMDDLAAADHETLTITGINVGTQPLYLGDTFTSSATSYAAPDGTPCAGFGATSLQSGTACAATGSSYKFTYDNESHPLNVLAPYSCPGVFTSLYVCTDALDGWFAPAWSSPSWENDSSVETAFIVPASTLLNVSAPATSATSTGGTAEFTFPWDLPGAPSLTYEPTYAFDVVQAGVTYVTVTIGTGANQAWRYADSPANDYTTAPGDQVWLPGGWFGVGNSCSLGVQSRPCDAGDVNVNNVNGTWVMEYGSNFCSLFPSASGCGGSNQGPPTNGTTNQTGGFVSNSYTVTGEWIIIGLVVLGVLLLIVYAGGEEEGKDKGKGVRKDKSGTLGGRRLHHDRQAKSGRDWRMAEHDASGIALTVIAGVIVVGIVYGLTTGGFLGVILSTTQALGTAMGMVFGLVVVLLVFAGTEKAPSGSGGRPKGDA